MFIISLMTLDSIISQRYLTKSEANSEVHLTCIVYDVQQEATPLVFLSFFNIGSNVQCF